jgi:hypothetical protein
MRWTGTNPKCCWELGMPERGKADKGWKGGREDGWKVTGKGGGGGWDAYYE